MKKYIDADLLKSELEDLNESVRLYYMGVFDVINSQPVADVAEVVRCKDCKHLRIDKDFQAGRYCTIRNVDGGGFCKDDDFCSYGELDRNILSMNLRR